MTALIMQTSARWSILHVHHLDWMVAVEKVRLCLCAISFI